ncbi:hypothetical protein IWZ00DRAFT_13085 [Phyllosticta capitalensis]|uniref:Uncharacterized protein n=1 Tax=Phyllosticta capitalensis TaxID=121624 RepID=A0ABR1Z2G6_9PEZI
MHIGRQRNSRVCLLSSVPGRPASARTRSTPSSHSSSVQFPVQFPACSRLQSARTARKLDKKELVFQPFVDQSQKPTARKKYNFIMTTSRLSFPWLHGYVVRCRSSTSLCVDSRGVEVLEQPLQTNSAKRPSMGPQLDEQDHHPSDRWPTSLILASRPSCRFTLICCHRHDCASSAFDLLLRLPGRVCPCSTAVDRGCFLEMRAPLLGDLDF